MNHTTLFAIHLLVHAVWLASAPTVEVMDRGKDFNGSTIGVRTTLHVIRANESWWMMEGPAELLEIATPLPGRENDGEGFFWFSPATDASYMHRFGMIKVNNVNRNRNNIDRTSVLLPVVIIWRANDPTPENIKRVEKLAKKCRPVSIPRPTIPLNGRGA